MMMKDYRSPVLISGIVGEGTECRQTVLQLMYKLLRAITAITARLLKYPLCVSSYVILLVYD